MVCKEAIETGILRFRQTVAVRLDGLVHKVEFLVVGVWFRSYLGNDGVGVGDRLGCGVVGKAEWEFFPIYPQEGERAEGEQGPCLRLGNGGDGEDAAGGVVGALVFGIVEVER